MYRWNPADYAANSQAQLQWAEELISRFAFRGNESVLDIGCGDGRITAAVARAVPEGSVLGVDGSADFIAYAQQQFPRSACPNIQFRQMDARSIQCDHTCDLIYSNAALHWIDDHLAVLSRCARLLKPHGRIIVSCGGKGNASGIIATLDRFIRRRRWSEYFNGFDFPYFFYSPDDYAVWLPEAGLRASRAELVRKDMIHENRDRLVGWIRTTWMPYTHRIPESERDAFINEFVDLYLQEYPVDAAGRTHVLMVRLEVEARLAGAGN